MALHRTKCMAPGPGHGQDYATSDDPTKIAGIPIIVSAVLILLLLLFVWANRPKRNIAGLARKAALQRAEKSNGTD